jgi:hypothetical protein
VVHTGRTRGASSASGLEVAMVRSVIRHVARMEVEEIRTEFLLGNLFDNSHVRI